jgi:hypothetical protein
VWSISLVNNFNKAGTTVITELGRSRDNPLLRPCLAPAVEQGRVGKETWHIDFDLSGCGLDYVVGDSPGIAAEHLTDRSVAISSRPVRSEPASIWHLLITHCALGFLTSPAAKGASTFKMMDVCHKSVDTFEAS